MKGMKILHLTLYKQWFIEILNGEKKIEYRVYSDYWVDRLKKEYDYIKFVNGYGKHRPWMLIKIDKIIAKGRIFEIHLGDVSETGNCKILEGKE